MLRKGWHKINIELGAEFLLSQQSSEVISGGTKVCAVIIFMLCVHNFNIMNFVCISEYCGHVGHDTDIACVVGCECVCASPLIIKSKFLEVQATTK